MAGVSQTNSFNAFDADGVTTVFSFTFFVYSNDTVKVYTVLNDVETEVTTGITISINQSNIGGTVTFDTAPADAVGDVLIRREVPYIQGTELADLTRLKESAIETALNTLVLQIQQLESDVQRSIRYNETSGVTSNTVASPVDGSLLSFDGTTGRITPITLASVSTDLDTILTSLAVGDFLKYNGSAWVNVDSVGADDLATDAVTTTKIKDNAVTTDKILDGAVTTDKLGASVVDDLSTYVLLGEYTASGDTSVDIGDGLDLDAVIDGTYTQYILKYFDVTGIGSSTSFYLRLSTDGGATFVSTNDYTYGNVVITNSTINRQYTTTSTQFEIAEISGSAGLGTAGEVSLFTPNVNNRNRILFSGSFDSTASLLYKTGYGGGRTNTSYGYDALRVYAASGNIASGTFKLYGVK